jgi:hypothetical protein
MPMSYMSEKVRCQMRSGTTIESGLYLFIVYVERAALTLRISSYPVSVN